MEDIVFAYHKCRILDEKNIHQKNSGFKVFCAKNLKNQNVLRDIVRKVDLIYGCEFHNYGDHGHQSNGGLDVVIVKEMKKYSVSYGICASDIMDYLIKGKLILHRIKQNLLLLKKKKVPVIIFSGDELYSEEELLFLKHFFRHI